MKEIINPFNTFKAYLIERRGELDDVLNAIKPSFGHEGTGLDKLYGLVVTGCVSVPVNYPFIAIFSQDSMDDGFSVTFTSPDDFQHGHGGLFEFEIKRTDNQSPYTQRFTRYQIPADNIFDAYLQLGQTFHDDVAYELEVVSCSQVK